MSATPRSSEGSYVSLSEVATELRMSRSAVYARLASGRLGSEALGARSVGYGPRRWNASPRTCGTSDGPRAMERANGRAKHREQRGDDGI